jgi:hypothetical protein
MQRWSGWTWSTPQNPAWAHIYIMPTRCLTKWPKELYFRILPNFLVDVIQIIFGTCWWWWCAKRSWFEKIQNGYDLNSALMLNLGLIILSN